MAVTASTSEQFDFALALIKSSGTPLLVLDKDLVILAGSSSFCSAFQIDPTAVKGNSMSVLGSGAAA
ncbi:hypothetical protein [Rhizobium mulingense]|uniref:hypothetical protein n=1 Tax=Rhizobium mulingense TaxID=3031128 RepID=UPI002B4736EA|nr:hypothetical protein [Rhizobium sp. MJ21]MEB3046854.1 hypothetical protein [Rhizobium sp. MJ21]